jgi:hypothetical protein
MGNKLRLFLRELFGSRLMLRLEEDLIRLRLDYDERLQEKDRIIAELRAEKQALQSKAALYEMTLLPHASRAGADLVNYQRPKTPDFGLGWTDIPKTETRWEKVSREHDERIAKEIEEEKQAVQTAI